MYEQTLGQPAPDAYLLHVRGSSFELGEDISASSSEAVDNAWQFLDNLFAGPCEDWGPALRAASSETSTQV